MTDTDGRAFERAHAPVWLTDLVDADGGLAPAAIASTVGQHDVVVGQVVDEELLALAPQRGADPHWTPWLAARDEPERAVASDVVRRHQLAFGAVTAVDEHGAAVTLDLAVVGDAIGRAHRQVVWQFEHRGRVVGRGGMLELDDGVWLQDQQGDDGMHLVMFRSAERCAGALTAALGAPAGSHVDRCRASSGPVWRTSAARQVVVVDAPVDQHEVARGLGALLG